MSSWFIILNIILLFSSSFVQARFRAHPKRRYPVSTVPPSVSFDDNSVFGSDDDSLRESRTTKSPNQANEQQMEKFTRLLCDRLNLKEPPDVTKNASDGTGVPPIVTQLEKEHIQKNEELHSHQRQKTPDDSQSTTERAILPGDSIAHDTCQRQLAAKLNLNKDSLHSIDCFRFTKSAGELKSLPTNQVIKQLRIYVRKNYFYSNNEQGNNITPDMFHIYQVFRPTANDTLHRPLSSLSDTIRLSISQVKQLHGNWFELTVDADNGPISIQQIYNQFIMPWYGLAINHVLQPSWSSFYRRYYSKKHSETLSRSDNEENGSKESQQQLPYMLVEYGEKIPLLSSSGHRGTRGADKTRSALPCDPKSPCCRRSLTIDLNLNSALNFIIYPRQIDIGECVGLCGTSGSSLKHTEVKNAQHKNEQNSGYNLLLLQNSLHSNRSKTQTQINKPDQQSGHCCSYSRTGGIELMYTTTNNGAIIRKFIPNIIVEECRCGLPATYHQV